jgi:ankyrin repeat protein
MGNGGSIRPKAPDEDDNSESSESQQSQSPIRVKDKNKRQSKTSSRRKRHHSGSESDHLGEDNHEGDDEEVNSVDDKPKENRRSKPDHHRRRSSSSHGLDIETESNGDDPPPAWTSARSGSSSASPVKKIIASPVIVSNQRSSRTTSTIIVPSDIFDTPASIALRDDDESSVDSSTHHKHKKSSNNSQPQSQAKETSNSRNNAAITSPATTADVSPVENSDDDDLSPMEILFQFIPYYGHGNATNDSTVRSSLSNLSIADIDSKDSSGNTLLLIACQYRCEDLVRIILNKGADANAINQQGVSGLHFACYRESTSINIAKQLLQAGANPETREYTYGCTPLHYCAGSGDMEFCKLLLTYGAEVMTYDYYNYTSIDYAREAGVTPLVLYLTQLAEKVATPLSNPVYNAPVPLDSPDWVGYLDPASNSRYYTNIITGESLWEQDFLDRMKQVNENPKEPTKPKESASPKITPSKKSLPKSPFSSDQNNIPKSSFSMSANSLPKTPGPMSASQSFVLSPTSHAKAIADIKQKHEQELETERKSYQQMIAEKEGLLVKLTSDVEMLTKQRQMIELEKQELNLQLERYQLHNNVDIIKLFQEKISSLESENQSLKSQCNHLQQELAYEREKLQSMENSISKLSLTNPETMLHDREQAEEKAKSLREKETQHHHAIRELEEKLLLTEQNLRNEHTNALFSWEEQEKTLRETISQLKQAHQQEVEELTRQVTTYKSSSAEKMIAMEMEVASYHKKMAENTRRADEAEEEMRKLQSEVEESRILRQQNLQLHK